MSTVYNIHVNNVCTHQNIIKSTYVVVQKNLKQLIFTLNELNISNLTRNDTRSGATKTNEQIQLKQLQQQQQSTKSQLLVDKCTHNVDAQRRHF